MGDGAVPANRLDRRKARTRQALIDAAVGLIAEGRGQQASIQEITDAADIGFGSFYNHFESKEQLFQTASTGVLDRWAQMIDAATAGLSDPAERFSMGLRSPAVSPGPTPRSPALSLAPGWSSSMHPAAWHLTPFVTSAPAKPRAASPSPTPRSR